MSENENVHEAEEPKSAEPAEVDIPDGYRLGNSTADFWHSVYYSDLAWFSLVIGQIVSAIGFLVTPFYGVFAVYSHVSAGATALAVLSVAAIPVAMLLEFALFVVFGRVSELRSRHERRP